MLALFYEGDLATRPSTKTPQSTRHTLIRMYECTGHSTQLLMSLLSNEQESTIASILDFAKEKSEKANERASK